MIAPLVGRGACKLKSERIEMGVKKRLNKNEARDSEIKNRN